MIFDKYEKHRAYHWSWYDNKPSYRQHVDYLKKWIKEKNVLEVGAGDGLIVAKLGIKGVDNNKLGVHLARKRGADVIYGDAYALSFKDNQFDAVLMSDTLEHLEFPDRALKEAYRITKEYFYLAVPLDVGPHDPYDYHRLSKKDLIELFTRNKFILVGEMKIVRSMTTHKKVYAKFKKV